MDSIIMVQLQLYGAIITPNQQTTFCLTLAFSYNVVGLFNVKKVYI